MLNKQRDWENQLKVTLIDAMKFNASERSGFPDVSEKNIQEIV